MAAVFAEASRAKSDVLGPMTGRRYIESLRDGREVWIDGERVDDVTSGLQGHDRRTGAHLPSAE